MKKCLSAGLAGVLAAFAFLAAAPAPAQAQGGHNPANDATQCISLTELNGAVSLLNNCPFAIEAVWCVEGHDCNPSYSNTWTIGGGRSYPVYGSQSGGRVMWAACRGPNSINTYGLPPFRHQCPDQ